MMIKNTLLILGGIFLFVILLLVGAGVWFGYNSAAYDETAVPYITEAIPKIATWNPDTLRSYMSDEALSGTSDEEFNKVVSFFSRVGDLVSLGEPALQNISTSTEVASGATVLTYVLSATFEKGDATLSLALVAEEDGFSIYSFNMNSAALMAP